MAEIVEKRLVDDLDGTTPAVETVRLAFGNKHFELDLSEEHAKELQNDLSKWTKHGRSVTPNPRVKRTGAAGRATDAQIRQWAIESGEFDKVPDRGRIRNEIIDAYNKAHK